MVHFFFCLFTVPIPSCMHSVVLTAQSLKSGTMAWAGCCSVGSINHKAKKKKKKKKKGKEKKERNNYCFLERDHEAKESAEFKLKSIQKN